MLTIIDYNRAESFHQIVDFQYIFFRKNEAFPLVYGVGVKENLLS